MSVTARTRLFLLLGDPVDHSLSPALQNAGFRDRGLDAVYAALRVSPELVAPVMRAVARSGGGGNITVPHKQVAAVAADHATESVRATGACNVFWWDEARGLCVDNTDVAAFRGAAEAVLGSGLGGARLLLLGAGGAARAVAYAALEAGAERVEIINRTRARAERLAGDLDGKDRLRVVNGPSSDTGEAYDLVVNATSLGLESSDRVPLDLASIRTRAVLDLVYSPDGTAWVRGAREAGIDAEDGRRMLVLQAAAAFRRWFDVDPPLAAMYGAVGLDLRKYSG